MLDLKIKNGQCYIDGNLKNIDIAVKDGKIHDIGQITDIAIKAPADDVARIQELHLPIYHAICGFVENKMFP